MTVDFQPSPTQARPYTDDTIRQRIESCPKLASLQSINRALAEVLNSEYSVASQIAGIIRRDPSLSARLLRMVNSVYFGLATRVNSLEEAVFFLGLRQIRELATATPVIEEMERFQTKTSAGLPWRELWKHSIGTALMTREILSSTGLSDEDDTHYLVGLLHNVGKIVMATAFPEELRQLVGLPAGSVAQFAEQERHILGWDHARIGAHFLRRHNLPEEIAEAVEYHNHPEDAPEFQHLAAAVQVADHLVRHIGIEGGFETVPPIAVNAWLQLPGWQILYGSLENGAPSIQASLAQSLRRLPQLLSGMI